MNRTSFDVIPKFDSTTKEISDMLLQEALARARMREAEQAAQEHRLARRVAAARYWQRLANWAARKAAHANAAL